MFAIHQDLVSDPFLFVSQVLSGGRVLSLKSALVSDTGKYTCVAVNAGGEQQREYDLKVYGEHIDSLPARSFIVHVYSKLYYLNQDYGIDSFNWSKKTSLKSSCLQLLICFNVFQQYKTWTTRTIFGKGLD